MTDEPAGRTGDDEPDPAELLRSDPALTGHRDDDAATDDDARTPDTAPTGGRAEGG